MENNEKHPEFTVYLKAWKGVPLKERQENSALLETQKKQLIIDITKLAQQDGDDIIINCTPAPERAYIGLRCDPAFVEKLKTLPAVGDVYPVVYATIPNPMDMLFLALSQKKNFTVLYVEPKVKDENELSKAFNDTLFKGVGDMMQRRIEKLAQDVGADIRIVDRLDTISCVTIECDCSFAAELARLKGIVEVKQTPGAVVSEDNAAKRAHHCRKKNGLD